MKPQTILTLTLIALLLSTGLVLGVPTLIEETEYFNDGTAALPSGSDDVEVLGGSLQLARESRFTEISELTVYDMADAGGYLYLATRDGLMQYDGTTLTTLQTGPCTTVNFHRGYCYAGFLDGSVIKWTGSAVNIATDSARASITAIEDFGTSGQIVLSGDRLYRISATDGWSLHEDWDEDGHKDWMGLYPYSHEGDIIYVPEDVHEYIEENGNIAEGRLRLMMGEWWLGLGGSFSFDYWWGLEVLDRYTDAWFDKDIRSTVDENQLMSMSWEGYTEADDGTKYLLSRHHIWLYGDGHFYPTAYDRLSAYGEIESYDYHHGGATSPVNSPQVIISEDEDLSVFVKGSNAYSKTYVNSDVSALSRIDSQYFIGYDNNRIKVVNSLADSTEEVFNLGLASAGGIKCFEGYNSKYYVGANDFFGYITLENYVASGVYVSEPEIKDMAIYGAYVDWEVTTLANTYTYVYASNNGGTEWYNITDDKATRFDFPNIGSANESAHLTWRYRVIMKGDTEITPEMADINWTLYCYDTPEITEMSPAVTPLNPNGIYYTNEAVDFEIKIEDVDFKGTYTLRYNFGDPNANTTNPNTAEFNITSSSYQQSNVSHIYSDDGVYTVTANITESGGLTSENTFSITIYNRAPTCSVSPVVVRAHPGTTVNMAVSGYDSDGTITGYLWTLSDGTTFNTASVSHVFTEDYRGYAYAQVKDDDNEWSIKTIEDGDGRISAVDMDIAADTRPDASWTYSPSSPIMGDTITFTFTGGDLEGSIASYNWTFGGLANSVNANPTYVFNLPGKYEVALTVADSAGQSSTFTRTIKVSPAPVVGDWIVTEDQTVENWTIIMRGNLIIRSPATLTLKNSTIYFDCSTHGQYGVLVSDGGNLTTNTVTIKPTYRVDSEEAVFRYHYIDFQVEGELYAYNTWFQALWENKISNVDGLSLLATSSAVLENSWIVGCEIDGLGMFPLIIYPTLSIKNLEIKYCGGGMWGTGAVSADGLEIYDCSTGINAVAGAWALEDLTVSRTLLKGIEVYAGTFTLDGLTLTQCGNDGIITRLDNSGFDNVSIVGTGSGCTGFMATSNSAPVYLNNSDVRLADYGVVAVAGAIVYGYGLAVSDMPTTGRDFYTTATGIIYVYNYITADVKIRGVAADSWASFLTDAVEVNNQTFTGTSQPVAMLHLSATGGVQTLSNNTVAVSCDDGFETRTVNASTTHTEYFAFGDPETSTGATGANVDGEINYSQFLILILVFALVGAMWYFKWFDDQQRLWITAITAIGSVIWLMWSSLSAGEFDTSVLAALGVLAASGLLYYYKGYGRGKESLWWGGTAAVAGTVWLYLNGNLLGIYVILMVFAVVYMGYYIVSRSIQLTIGSALIILGIFLAVSLAGAWIFGLWAPFALLGGGVSMLTDGISDTLGGWYPGQRAVEWAGDFFGGWF